VLLAGSEGKVKLLSEMVERMRNDSLHEKENFSEQEVDLVKSTDRPLRELSENRKLRLSDGKLGEKMKQEAARMRAEIAKLRSRVQEKETTILNVQMQLSSATTSCKEMEVLMGKTVSEKEKKLQSQLQAAVKETTRFRAQVQQCEAEMERLTMLLLEVQERHTEAEQSWMAEKVQLESYRHEAELQAATKKLKLPARFAKIDKWQRQLSEADKLMNMLVVANEKSKQECSVASAEAGMADKLVQELLEAVAMTKEQLDASMSHAEGEIRSLVAETQLLKTDLKRDILTLRRAQPVLVDEVKRSLEILPSVKCLESERRSWEQQCKSANAMLAEKEATIRGLHDEVNKARQQTSSVRTDQGATVRVLQEKEEIIRKLLNEVNQLKQSADRNMSLRQSFTKEATDLGHYSISTPLNHNADRNMSLRQSLTKEADFGLGLGPAPLRRSFSLKLIEEKEMTLNVLKEEQEYLKTMVFSLDTENAELQQQLLDFEADSSAFKSTIANLQRELDDSNRQRSQDVAGLAEQLQESTRHISELECQRKELRDEMQRQAVSFAALYEQLQKQERLEDLVRTDECKAVENEEVLQVLEEEKAELKFMVERLDAEMMACQSESKQLKRQVQALQQELEHEKLQLKDVSEVRATLEADLARKTDETAVVSRELHLLRISAEKLARETEKLRSLVEELERNRVLLEEQLQCVRDARSNVEELEAEKDKLQGDLNLFMEQLEMNQAIGKEQDVVTSEARKVVSISRCDYSHVLEYLSFLLEW
jgi:chromosome segregation ATPase